MDGPLHHCVHCFILLFMHLFSTSNLASVDCGEQSRVKDLLKVLTHFDTQSSSQRRFELVLSTLSRLVTMFQWYRVQIVTATNNAWHTSCQKSSTIYM